jgi:4-hydroxy-2-oxoheptanedioate aldolase
MTSMLQGIDARGVPTIVRVAWNEPSGIMKALDGGAQGVIVQMVNSAEKAVAATRACRYPPLGFRSWGPMRTSLSDPNHDPARANSRVVCIVIVETPEAVNAVDEIAAVEGLDSVVIGRYDLSLSTNLNLTTPGSKPSDAEQIAHLLAACDRVGIPVGITSRTADDVHKRRAQGFRLLQLGSDLEFLSNAATTTVRDARPRSTDVSPPRS